MAREVYYLKKAREAGFSNIPTLINIDEKNAQIEIEYIEGSKLERMDESTIRTISHMTKALSESIDPEGYQHKAKDWLEDICQYAEGVIERK